MLVSRLSATAAFAALLCSLPAPAQSDHDGWYAVVSANLTTWSPPAPGPGGIHLVHPTKGTRVSLTGLPVDLTGVGTKYAQGARCAAFDPATGHLWVGEVSNNGLEVDLFEIAWSGSTAKVVRKVAVGSSGDTGNQGGYTAVHGLARHPDGRLFMRLTNIKKGPMAGFTLASYDPATNTLTGHTTSPALGPNAFDKIVIDETGRTMYLRDQANLVAIDVATMQLTYLVKDLIGLPGRPVDIDATGTKLILADANTLSNPSRNVQYYDIPTGRFTACNSGISAQLNGLGRERNTNALAIARSTFGAANEVYRLDACGNKPVLLSAGPSGGWGLLTALEILQAPRGYGAPSPRPGLLFSVQPGDGRPEVGNGKFQVNVFRAPNVPAGSGALIVGTKETVFPLPPPIGGTLLVDPAPGLVLLPVSLNGLLNPIPIPIPNQAVLAGLPVRLQVIRQISASSYVLTDGLRFTIL